MEDGKSCLFFYRHDRRGVGFEGSIVFRLGGEVFLDAVALAKAINDAFADGISPGISRRPVRPASLARTFIKGGLCPVAQEVLTLFSLLGGEGGLDEESLSDGDFFDLGLDGAEFINGLENLVLAGIVLAKRVLEGIALVSEFGLEVHEFVAGFGIGGIEGFDLVIGEFEVFTDFFRAPEGTKFRRAEAFLWSNSCSGSDSGGLGSSDSLLAAPMPLLGASLGLANSGRDMVGVRAVGAFDFRLFARAGASGPLALLGVNGACDKSDGHQCGQGEIQ